MSDEMKGAELDSLLKSSVRFKNKAAVKDDGLRLADEDKQWWLDAKIGIFFHWGLFSIPGRGEWTMFNEKIPYEEYRKLAWQFNPQNFEMSSLTEIAKEAGANYMVMVTRHHDGFALWNSKGSYDSYTSYATGAKRDFVREYADACRNAGLRVGLYYSPMDWRFPGYFNPEGLRENAELMKRQGYAQIEELCRDYGKIDILWYDGGWLAHKGSDADSAWFWEPVKLNRMVRSYQPKVMINPRSGWEGDFECDEGGHKITGGIVHTPWEKCMTITGSWAWRPGDPVLSSPEVIKMIVNVVCRGGNILLNIAPDKDGKVTDEAVRTLKEVGRWLKTYGNSIYGTRAGVFEPVDDVYGSTCRDNEIFLHILDFKAFHNLKLPAINEKILSCDTYDGVLCEFTQDKTGIKITVPEEYANDIDIIVKIRV